MFAPSIWTTRTFLRWIQVNFPKHLLLLSRRRPSGPLDKERSSLQTSSTHSLSRKIIEKEYWPASLAMKILSSRYLKQRATRTLQMICHSEGRVESWLKSFSSHPKNLSDFLEHKCFSLDQVCFRHFVFLVLHTKRTWFLKIRGNINILGPHAFEQVEGWKKKCVKDRISHDSLPKLIYNPVSLILAAGIISEWYCI